MVKPSDQLRPGKGTRGNVLGVFSLLLDEFTAVLGVQPKLCDSQEWQAGPSGSDGATSIPGLLLKKPLGFK